MTPPYKVPRLSKSTVSKHIEVTGAGGRPVRSCCLKDKEFVFELVRKVLETGGAHKNTNSFHDIK